MPKILYLLCILLTHFSFAQTSIQKTTQVEGKITLKNQSRLQCIDFAISKSVTLANANIDKQIATAKINELKAAALPQIHGNASVIDNFVIPKTFFNAQQFNPNLPDALTAATLQAQYGSQVTISVTQTLFNASYFLGSKAAKIYTELAEKNSKQTENEIHYTISKAYYTVLVNEERLKIILENLKSMEELLRTTQAMFENGTIEKLDISKIEVRLANLQTEFNKLTQFTELAKSLLKFQMGLSQDDEITLSENISNLNSQLGNSSYYDNYDYNNIFDYNLRNEFTVLQSQKDLQNLAIQSHARSYLPSAYLFANGGANTGSLNFGNLFVPTNWYSFFSVGINVNIPIFDGFQKLHLGQQKKLTLQKTENSLNELKRFIDFQQKQARITLKNAHSTLTNQHRNKELALEVLKITKIKYTEGVGTNSEVLAADAAHKEAEANYFSALYEVLMAKIEVDKSLGNRN